MHPRINDCIVLREMIPNKQICTSLWYMLSKYLYFNISLWCIYVIWIFVFKYFSLIYVLRMVIAGGRGVGKSALAVRFLTRRSRCVFFYISVLSTFTYIHDLHFHIEGSSVSMSTVPSWSTPRRSRWTGRGWPSRSTTPTARYNIII